MGVEAFPSSIMRGYRIAMSDPGGPVYLCFDVTDQEQRSKRKYRCRTRNAFARQRRCKRTTTRSKKRRSYLSAQNPVILADYVGAITTR